MAVNPLNLVQGPADLYYADFGTTEPLDSAVASAPSASWIDAGATDGGVTMTVGLGFSVMTVDQVVEEMGRRLISKTFSVTTNLAEATLSNLKTILNDGVIATGTGFQTYDQGSSNSGDVPTYRALIIDGWAPGTVTAQKRRRVIIRKVLSTEPIALGYNKENKLIYAVTWMGHYVSTVIKPMHVVDGT